MPGPRGLRSATRLVPMRLPALKKVWVV